MTIEEIVKECLKRGIYVSGVELWENDTLAYIIEGFSKSGTATLYTENEQIKCKTRYGQIDTIEDFRDLAYVAFEWNKGYSDREPFGWDHRWAPIFIEYGWLEKKERLITEYTAK